MIQYLHCKQDMENLCKSVYLLTTQQLVDPVHGNSGLGL